MAREHVTVLSKECDRSQGGVCMLGTPCAKAQSREQAILLLEEEGETRRGHTGGPIGGSSKGFGVCLEKDKWKPGKG